MCQAKKACWSIDGPCTCPGYMIPYWALSLEQSPPAGLLGVAGRKERLCISTGHLDVLHAAWKAWETLLRRALRRWRLYHVALTVCGSQRLDRGNPDLACSRREATGGLLDARPRSQPPRGCPFLRSCHSASPPRPLGACVVPILAEGDGGAMCLCLSAASKGNT